MNSLSQCLNGEMVISLSMVQRAPAEDMVLLAFSPENVAGMSKIMHNPIRSIADVQLQAMETLGWSLVATEGDVNKIPAALSMFLLERLEDPIKVARIILTDTMSSGGR